MKKIAIIYSEYTPTIDAIKSHLDGYEIILSKQIPDKGFDLVVNVNSGIDFRDNTICVHHSLLPAFEGEEPVKQAFLAGVKVTGITFYYTNPYKIIAQYPVFIPNAAHFDDIEKELEYLEQTIYPVIIEKILKNEPFELKNILTKNCGGCLGCKH